MAKVSKVVNPLSLLVFVLAMVVPNLVVAQDQPEADQEPTTQPADEEAEDFLQDPGTTDTPEQEPTTEESEETEETDENVDETPRHLQFGHRFQGGIGVLVGSGYFLEVAYGGDYCYQEGEEEPSVCHGRSPVFLDIQASFGVTNRLEILAEYRLGLITENFGNEVGQNIRESRPMAIGVGIRYYIGAENRFKFFVGALIDVDFTKGLKTDFTLRPIFGFLVEFVRWVGFFVQASVELGFIRSFSISLDGAAGFQFRFP